MIVLSDSEHKALSEMTIDNKWQWFNFIGHHLYICYICNSEINNYKDNFNAHGLRHLKLKAFL